MKKIFLLTIASIAIVSLNAQVDKDKGEGSGKIPDANESHTYIGPGVSYYFLPIASLNSSLSEVGIKTGFTNAIGLGLDRGYNVISSKLTHGVTGMMSFHYLLPQHVNSANDSAKFSLNGYNAQFDLMGANFLKSETVTLTGGIGWAFGRLKVTQDLAGVKNTYYNKYFAPELRLEFNVRLADHFYVGLRYAYRSDITSASWTKKVDSANNLPFTDMTGTMVGAFIGYGK